MSAICESPSMKTEVSCQQKLNTECLEKLLLTATALKNLTFRKEIYLVPQVGLEKCKLSSLHFKKVANRLVSTRKFLAWKCSNCRVCVCMYILCTAQYPQRAGEASVSTFMPCPSNSRDSSWNVSTSLTDRMLGSEGIIHRDQRENQGQEPARPPELCLLSVNKDICFWPVSQQRGHGPGGNELLYSPLPIPAST